MRLTLKSALGWLFSVPILGFVLLTFSVGFPPFDDATTLDLTTHMVQHILIVTAGIMMAYPLHRKGYLRRLESRFWAYSALVVVVALTVFWHLPQFWDAAVLDPYVHAVEHASFLVIGLLIGSPMTALSDRAKIDVLLLGFFGHFFYGLLLLSSFKVYHLYDIANQGAMGVAVFSVGPAYWTGILLVVFRNRAWFREVSIVEEAPAGRGPPPSLAPKAGFTRTLRRAARATNAVLTVALVALLVGFYASSALSVGLASAPQHPASSVQVLILETPITWNFQPQSVTVVIGLNNTVVWVSHSLAYDTVTGTNSSLSSGQIAPGATFSYTFNEPGVYPYECIYHPWMTGTVRVLAPHA